MLNKDEVEGGKGFPMNFTFKNEVSIANIIEFVLVFAAVLAAWFTMDARVAVLEVALEAHKATPEIHQTTAMKEGHFMPRNEVNAELRALHKAIADLQKSADRINAKLDRMNR